MAPCQLTRGVVQIDEFPRISDLHNCARRLVQPGEFLNQRHRQIGAKVMSHSNGEPKVILAIRTLK